MPRVSPAVIVVDAFQASLGDGHDIGSLSARGYRGWYRDRSRYRQSACKSPVDDISDRWILTLFEYELR